MEQLHPNSTHLPCHLHVKVVTAVSSRHCILPRGSPAGNVGLRSLILESSGRFLACLASGPAAPTCLCGWACSPSPSEQKVPGDQDHSHSCSPGRVRAFVGCGGGGGLGKRSQSPTRLDPPAASQPLSTVLRVAGADLGQLNPAQNSGPHDSPSSSQPHRHSSLLFGPRSLIWQLSGLVCSCSVLSKGHSWWV